MNLLENLFEQCHNRLENMFQTYLNQPHYPSKELQEAMGYAVQNGGKRIRPSLVYIIGHLFDVPLENLDPAACAIEFIHAYSLIHDDLPAMDNSDLRRGKPSCHKAYSEATAILAGDALQPLAFEIIAIHPCTLTTQQRLNTIHILSKAAGVAGMAAGQTLDMYRLKTGALLVASVKAGIIASAVQDDHTSSALERYISNIGLAFQIQDDLLDVLGSEMTGKPQHIDNTNKKITYPKLIGIEKTQEKVQQLFSSALQAIEFLGNNAEILRELAYYLLKRNK
jgi:farnesyl diphosphate synthase